MVMGQRPTRKNESQHVTPAKLVPAKAGSGGPCRVELHSRFPAFAEDKLRGNDVTFAGANFGPCAAAPRSGALFRALFPLSGGYRMSPRTQAVHVLEAAILLFVAQCHQGIDLGGPAGGNVAGDKRNTGQEQGNHDKRRRVPGRDAVEQA